MKSYRIAVWLLLVLAALPGVAHAGLELEMGPSVAVFKYEEPGLMKIEGSLQGVELDLKYVTERGHVLGANCSFHTGRNWYEGVDSEGAPLEFDTNDVIFETLGYYGVRTEIPAWGRKLGLMPYAGLKYRFWRDDLLHEYGYERKIVQYFLAAGAEAAVPLGGPWSLKLRAEGQYLASGDVRSQLSEVGEQYGNARNDQDFGSGYGMLLKLGLERECERFSYGVRGFWQMYKVDDSDRDIVQFGNRRAQVYEPKNTTNIYGVQAYMAF